MARLRAVFLLGLTAVCAGLVAAPAACADATVTPAVALGERAPDFTALDSDGNAVTLSSLHGRPVLLKFFRGHW